MDIISILGLVLGLAVLIMMGFKGWGMIPTSIVGALVVVITNRMDLWEALSTHYGTFMKNYAGDYFLMFFLGTLFGALMGSSGAAKSIACKIVDLMGSKRALLIVVITSAVLSYGGVSFAVVVFTLYPIALVLFKEGNVSKRLFLRRCSPAVPPSPWWACRAAHRTRISCPLRYWEPRPTLLPSTVSLFPASSSL